MVQGLRSNRDKGWRSCQETKRDLTLLLYPIHGPYLAYLQIRDSNNFNNKSASLEEGAKILHFFRNTFSVERSIFNKSFHDDSTAWGK